MYKADDLSFSLLVSVETVVSTFASFAFDIVDFVMIFRGKNSLFISFVGFSVLKFFFRSFHSLIWATGDWKHTQNWTN